ncbi:Protein phosphatase 1 regulatory subunit 21 [Eumeta japonica]|uniref:Protein phosphatase 1 regulatory subunit 21 n=1 Tax=Eumeta variegata TaxID=151549 RepID=A0A4C1YI30_EUMVA|nr:Protein phosphatase 1 regulatory subunit 21 [Eumeta japonica]
MEGLPSGDVQAKYQKLASEYSKLRAHVKVLKKGVIDEQAKSNELRDLLKEKEKAYRKGELEIDSLNFRNQQLTRRVSVLQEELDALQQKQSKKSKNKNDEKHVPSTSLGAALDYGLLKEELQKKIIENAQFASQLKLSLEDYQKIINENENKYKCEIARLKNKNQELQFALEEAAKERNSSTPNKMQLPSGNQLASCNGDFFSEGGSLVGSEDALSSTDYNVNEQLCVKMQSLEQSLKVIVKTGSLAFTCATSFRHAMQRTAQDVTLSLVLKMPHFSWLPKVAPELIVRYGAYVSARAVVSFLERDVFQRAVEQPPPHAALRLELFSLGI